MADILSEEIKSRTAQGPVDCEVCKGLVNVFKNVIQTNTSITHLDELAYEICLRLNIDGWTPFVCHGTIREFGAEVVYVISERFLVPEAICSALNFCSREETEFMWPRLDTTKNPAWQKMMKNTLETIKMEQARDAPPVDLDDPIGSFVHISDIHYDERYKIGANALCERPLCCREASAVPLNQTSFRAAGQWGDYNCDPPVSLVQNLWKTLSELPQQPEFMIYTGDNSAHDIWAQTQNMQQQRSVRLFENIQEQLPGWQMYPSLGNHESYPVDQFSAPPTMQWLYESVADSWAPWFSDSVLETFRYAGYYTTQVTPGLRLIALNTQYCDANDFWLLLDWQDPTGQIAWLNQTLQAAEAGNEKVWIIGHIPFNSGACLDSYEEPLWSLVDQFKDTITALFFGHTHKDSFMVFKDFATNTDPIAIGYIAPSVTTYTEKNNAFRIVEYNRTSFEVVNYHQYILNLTEANASGTPHWFKEYDPIDAYNMKSLSPRQWLNVVEKFKYDPQLLNLYNYYHSCSYGSLESQSCTGSCINSTTCTLEASTSIIEQQCTGSSPSPGLSTFMNRFCPAWWEQ